jgi:integrase/recombinase XerD
MAQQSRLTLSQTYTGFIYYKTAIGKSPHTIADYKVTHKKLSVFLPDDPLFCSITRQKMIEFFSWLQTDYRSEPDGVAPRGSIKLSPKTILNIHTNLSALWHWAVDEEIVERNIIRAIDPPPVEVPVIVEYTKEEIAALLKACDETRSWRNRDEIKTKRHTAMRDRAIVKVLVDTGIRAEELCNILISDVNLNANSMVVRGKGAGNDQAERTVYFGRLTAKALWQYLLPRANQKNKNAPLFLKRDTLDDSPLNRNALYQMLAELGKRAGVTHVYPHRFRHTFAITYLRNGGDVITLQSLLGHSDLEMVKRYAQIAQSDCANAHRKASPVDNWRL